MPGKELQDYCLRQRCSYPEVAEKAFVVNVLGSLKVITIFSDSRVCDALVWPGLVP